MEVSLLVPSMRQVLVVVGVCVLGAGGGVPLKGKAYLFFPLRPCSGVLWRD